MGSSPTGPTMKTILDLTTDQAIEIAKLIYPFPGEMEKIQVVKHPYFREHYEDAREFIRIHFVAPVMADRKFTIKVEISANLDCFMSYEKSEPCGDDKIRQWNETLPNVNQYEVQKRFREWKIFPSHKNQRRKLVL